MARQQSVAVVGLRRPKATEPIRLWLHECGGCVSAISVDPFCRKGLRSPAATCDQIRFHFKVMSPEITTPLFVSPRNIPLHGSCHRNHFGIITPCLSVANPNDSLPSFRPKTPATAPPVVTDPHVGCIISSMSLLSRIDSALSTTHTRPHEAEKFNA